MDLSSDRILNDDDEGDDKTLHVSGIFSSHHQEFSTAHSALVNFLQFSDDRFQVASGWNCLQFKRSSKNCMKLSSAECTAENS